ncbi:MAG TPA: pseudouridine synthase [bacterium]|nr:pseudouridine synthase [bacterium]
MGHANEPPRLLMLNKPKGYVVTRSDEKGRKTVYDLLPDWAYNDLWMPVGRLDLDSKGLLLFTQDAKLSERLTRPGSCPKTYEVWVRGHVNSEHVMKMLKGIRDKDEVLKAIRIDLKGGAGPKTRVEVELDEGKNRHIRRMFGALKDPKFGTPLKVVDLKRTRIGNLALDVQSGQWRFLEGPDEKKLL